VPQDSHTIFVVPKGIDPAIRKCLVQAVDESVKSAEYKALMDKFDNAPLNLGEDGARALVGRAAGFYKDAIAKLGAAKK
jgi:tripartite-type tricarboxylate transporter receptor subunit TctC